MLVSTRPAVQRFIALPLSNLGVAYGTCHSVDACFQCPGLDAGAVGSWSSTVMVPAIGMLVFSKISSSPIHNMNGQSC